MGNTYTEKEMMLAAMISNCRITEDIISLTRRNFYLAEDEAPTFRQIVLTCEAQKPPYDLWFREHEEGDVNNEAKFFEWAKTEDFGDWKIVGIYDDNNNSGFYGLAIETGEYTDNGVENGVIFSARGTEPNTLQQFVLDLVMTDLDIINSELTEQEKVMYEFLDNQFAQLLEEKGYSNLATSGHSLGGYLAFSAAAHMVDKGGYASQIFMQGTNIDGPGVTEENLANPENQVIYAAINDKLTHYHYTYVGGILTPICDNYISVTGASDWKMYGDEMSETQYQALVSLYGQEIADKMAFLSYYISGQSGKHALASLQFTEDGEFDIQYNERQDMVDVDTTIGIGPVMQGLVSGNFAVAI